MRLFLCGDVMTGRGIDQILLSPSEPTLYESYIRNARDYVWLAERHSGTIPRGVDSGYVWGAALAAIGEYAPHVCLMNLETSVTTHPQPWPEKGIHYRMHPANAAVLAAPAMHNSHDAAKAGQRHSNGNPSARQICYSLANNHVLDFGREGLAETLDTLESRGLSCCGAGLSPDDAAAPARPDGAGTAIFSVGTADSGIPGEWRAAGRRSGVYRLARLDSETIRQETGRIANELSANETGIVSLHWGGNWGWNISNAERSFAHELVDGAGISIVHGHSSHHVKGIELYHGALILYGCGDFITDYEGISGHEAYRPDLSLMYFADIDEASRRVIAVRIVPLQSYRFSLRPVSTADSNWVERTLNRESEQLGTAVVRTGDGGLCVRQ